MTNLPDLRTAIKLWQDSVSGICEWSSKEWLRDYIYHTNGVAVSAQKIADKCGLNPEKAYIIGILHDYGKIQNEKATNYPHFLLGYDKMTELGYFDVAKVCLTHSFPIKDFDFNNYIAYSKENLSVVKNLLKDIEYDDYDRLIQLCDILFEGINTVRYEYRILQIQQRYKLTADQTKGLEIGAKQNKEYFDKKCGCDIYKLLKI